MRVSSCLPAGHDVRRRSGAACRVRLVGREQHLAEPDDAVERRPQLVAHGRQEVALEPVRSRTGPCSARASSSTLRSRSALSLCCGPASLIRLRSMRLKAWRQVLELVAGLDLAADVQLAGGDGVGDFLEVLDRLDDDVADDEVAAGHDEEGGADGERDEQRPGWCGTPPRSTWVDRRMRTTAIRSPGLRSGPAGLGRRPWPGRRGSRRTTARPGSPRSSRTRSPWARSASPRPCAAGGQDADHPQVVAVRA